MRTILRSYLLFFFSFLVAEAASQEKNIAEHVDSILTQYATQFEPTRLHLHLDKTIYTKNETIWFSAYLYSALPDSFMHELLYVKLVRNNNDSLVRSYVFPMMENHGYGDILLPTSIADGEYKLIAYTNKLVNHQPSVVFKQLIQIRSEPAPDYSFRLQTLDTIANRRDSFFVRLQGQDPNGQPLFYHAIQYEFLLDKKRIVAGSASLDAAGSFLVKLPQVQNKSLALKLSFEADKTKKQVTLSVTPLAIHPQVSFFPEGGSIISNTSASVAIEVMDKNGRAIASPVSLFENGKLLTSIQSNGNGWGRFQFWAKPFHQYEARVIQPDTTYRFHLPTTQASGFSLQAEEGVVTDSLKLFIQVPSGTIHARLAIHNFKSVFWAADVKANRSHASLSLATDSLPTGLYAITLFNVNYQPQAERLVFIHRDRATVQVSTNKNIYATREKVLLNLRFDSLQKPIQRAQLSVSVTDITRLNLSNHPNILTSFFIKDELNLTSPNTLYFLAGQRKVLNELLLTKGWRRYSWQNAVIVHSKPKIIQTHVPGKGKVLSKKEFPAPHDLIVTNFENMYTLQTDSVGYFTIPLEFLITASEKPVLLAPVKEKRDVLRILLDTAYVGIEYRMTSIPVHEPIRGNTHTLGALNDPFPTKFGYKVLSTVVIKSKSTVGRFRSKTCADWVCQYNILNCENHPVGGEPVDGETYLYRFYRGEAQRVVYEGCQKVQALAPKAFVLIKKIQIGKTFYKPLYDSTGSTEPEYLSTLYWNPQISVNSNHFQDSFFTSDAVGTYLCIAEGLLNGRPVRTQYEFIVK